MVALVVVRWAVEVVGELVVSVVLASGILVWGLGRWAALERRLDRHPGPAHGPVVVARGPGRVDEAGEHVAFARALVAVSARYLAHCEVQADERRGDAGGVAVSTMTDDVMGLGWVPAPGAGSAARKAWPRTARMAWSLARRPLLPLAVAALVALGVMHGPMTAAVAAIVAAAGLSVWDHVHPASFDVTAGRVLRGSWRSAWTYGLRWRASMMFAGLGGRFDQSEWLPRVVRVRAGRYCDRVTVRMVVGQQPADWERRSDALAHAFGARSCRVELVPGRPGYLHLTFGRQDRLMTVVDPLPIPERVNLDAIPVGVTEDGETWCLAVSGGAHTLAAGCTGSGKGSLLWSLLHGLAPGIRDGLVDVRAG